jgi:hypothetical protein
MVEQIDKAVAAHGLWKTRLGQSIAGTLSLNPGEIGVDNRCEFGKWLHSLGGTSAASDPHYKEVFELHKAFHKAAAEVVTKVIAGDKIGAKASVGLQGEYTAVSSRLTTKLVEWKRKASKAT